MSPTGNRKPDLRPDAEHARTESAELGMLTKVVGDLLISISDEADENLLGEELRHPPIDMEVDPVLVLRVAVLEIVGEAGDGGEFVPGRRVEVGVAAAGVDRGVTDAEIAEARGIVGADGNVTGQIGHEVVHAGIPLQRGCCG